MKTNDELIDYLEKSIGILKTPAIIEAFRSIDRTDFVREGYKREAYQNYPLPIGNSQTISQPYTVAFMLELLQPKEDSHILDVGCGSCYTTALLAKIAKKGKVVGVEIDKKLVEFCKSNLRKYDFNNIEIYNADKLPPTKSKFDRILVSAAAERLPEELLNALKEGGRMVIPVQSSIFLIEKQNNKIKMQEHYGFAFVRLR
ncbi:protein-L-isoaspartate O-methyltransferase [Hippea maritima]|uniref:Protein-L-isoaspartate O-methyltransferase n=1 Tax=Hippea maritima (strain ATCC 700847 / DSM 10411 / MH2) TaxID=760142 RepID=F2LUA7_HIPMA|nr:protein-L-isoaspartate O-methyltransferase [Hippea maritima]AEA33433.1 Protein-L-isoaspartate(D-aspartate) O-methyltransferase [Hippea maritima DSM 10411]